MDGMYKYVMKLSHSTLQLQRNRVKKIESRRLSEGRLTVTFQGSCDIDMICLSGVRDVMALQRCVLFLEGLAKTLPEAVVSRASGSPFLSLEHTPPGRHQPNKGRLFFSGCKK